MCAQCAHWAVKPSQAYGANDWVEQIERIEWLNQEAIAPIPWWLQRPPYVRFAAAM